MFRPFGVFIFMFSFSAQAQVMFLECPEGTEKKSVMEKDEIHEWCADKDGVRTGGYSLRSTDGTPKVYVEYKDDKRNGQYVRYHKNGKPAEQGVIENDVPVGEWKRFHTNGAISDIGSWTDGEPSGPWKFYHSTGKLEAEGVYEDGDRSGVWKFYDDEGKFKSNRNYDKKGLFVEGGYLGTFDSQGHSHAGVFGVNWFPFQWPTLKGLSLSLRLGAIRASEDGPNGDSEPIKQISIIALGHYWELGNLMVGLQLGEVDVDSSNDNGGGGNKLGFLGIDTYITVNQKWVKRYGFNLMMLDNDVAAITAKAVLWEF